MITKLKKKFICILMSFVFSILLIVFIILCLLQIRQFHYDIHEAFHWAFGERDDIAFQLDMKKPSIKDKLDPMMRANTFTIYTDTNYQFQSLHTSFYQIDTTQAQEIITMIQNKKQQEGILWNSYLAYSYKETNSGYIFAIVDIHYHMQQMYQFLCISFLIGGLSLTAFLCMSIFFSKWALQPVEQAWIQQKQFIADASHELKTPLTIILADSDILLSTTSSEKEQKWLRSIQQEAMRMKKLVEQLLFLAKHDTNKIQIEMHTCHLSEIIWSCVLPYETIAYEHQLQLDSEIQDDLYVIGNQDQLKQMILIFLDNAIKYTPVHHTITVSCVKQEHYALLSIQNTGSYITSKDLPHVFERFYRCDRARVYQGGHGLGLSIASQIAQLHHITINVKSDQKQGTCFTLTIPLQKRTS